MRLASIIFPSLPCALAMCVQSVVRSLFVLSFGESVVAFFSIGSRSRIVPFVGLRPYRIGFTFVTSLGLRYR